MTRVNDDPYQGYSDQLARPVPLTGPMMTRGEARFVYGQMIKAMHDAPTLAALQEYLASVEPEIKQFENELPHLWNGDGEDFAGLSDEMLNQIARLGGGNTQVAVAA